MGSPPGHLRSGSMRSSNHALALQSSLAAFWMIATRAVGLVMGHERVCRAGDLNGHGLSVW